MQRKLISPVLTLQLEHRVVVLLESYNEVEFRSLEGRLFHELLAENLLVRVL